MSDEMDEVIPSSVFGSRHTPDCKSCARPATAYGRRLLAQFHGWPDRKEYPWNLLGPEDILAIEAEAAAPEPDGALDVERLAGVLVRIGGFAGNKPSETWREGAAIEVAQEIAREYAASDTPEGGS